jgi:hypothetical protein
MPTEVCSVSCQHLVERVEEEVRIVAGERQWRANLQHVAVAAGRADENALLAKRN